MSKKLTKEQFEQLPDFLKDDYEEKDGEFVNKALAKVKQTANDLDSKYKSVADKLAEFEKSKADEIEAAKAEAYEKAKADGDIEAITTRHNEQLEHTKSSAYKQGKEDAAKEFKIESAKSDANSIALKIAGELAVDEFAIELLQREFRSKIDVDGTTGDMTFLADDGSATSLKSDEFKTELMKNPKYSRLIKEDIAASGGGNANGSKSGRTQNEKFSDFTAAQLSAINKADPERYQRLLKTR